MEARHENCGRSGVQLSRETTTSCFMPMIFTGRRHSTTRGATIPLETTDGQKVYVDADSDYTQAETISFQPRYIYSRGRTHHGEANQQVDEAD